MLTWKELSGIIFGSLTVSAFYLVISGTRRKNVSSCRHKIELIIESSRQKIPPTHFLSFPLYNKEIIKNLEEFKSAVLETCRQVPVIMKLPLYNQLGNLSYVQDNYLYLHFLDFNILAIYSIGYIKTSLQLEKFC